MAGDSAEVLRIYQVGELTVVGFGGVDVPDEACIADYRTQLTELIEQHNCKTLAFDLSGVTVVPSGMLGVLISLKKTGLEIELYNPSPDILDVLAITKLDGMFTVREVDLDSES